MKKDSFNDICSSKHLKMLSTFVQSQDYRFTTMEFRERIYSSKQHTTRSLKYLKSAPPFQKRNLDNFPMPHTRRESLKLANDQRNGKKIADDRVRQAKVYSGSLREYSKQMFDFTVKRSCNHVFSDSQKTSENVKVNRMIGLVHRPKLFQGSSGPSRDGSILYNEKQKVLNSIRTRTPCEYTSRCNNERSNSRLCLQETINEKVRNYRILSSSHDLAASSMNKNTSVLDTDIVLFIPRNNSRELSFLSTRDNTDLRNGTVDTPFSEYQDLLSTDTRDPHEDQNVTSRVLNGELKTRDVVREDSIQNFQSTNISLRALLPPNTTCNLRLVSLDETSTSSSDEEEERELTPEIKKPEVSPPKSPSKKGKQQLPEPELKPEPVKPKLILKGPHCWVDDVTVSSVHSENENAVTLDSKERVGQQKAVDPVPDISKPIDPVPDISKPIDPVPDISNVSPKIGKYFNKTNLLNSNTSLEMRTNMNCVQTTNQQAFTSASNEIFKLVPVTNGQQCVNNFGNGDMVSQITIQENSKSELILPTFICPSSEKKSREAALKQWLATTCFMAGSRCVPML